MMFGAGIGIGMLTFATAEPMYHFGANPATIGRHRGQHRGNVRDAYIWSFTHWGLAAWASTPSSVWRWRSSAIGGVCR
jgi:choline/glycine/proline betaine transport protein